MIVSYPPFYPQQILDADGKPVAGGRILSFYAGTDVPLAMFAPDGVSLGSSVNIASDGTAVFCLKVGTPYKLVCVDANGATVWVRDRVKVSAGDGNPMEHAGSLIYGGLGGDPTELPIGSARTVLTSDGEKPRWQAPKVPATAGDTRYKSSVYEAIEPTAPLKRGQRVASGGRAWMTLEIEPSETEGDVLQTLKNEYDELFVGWGAGGMTNPMTGFGQMIFGGPGGAPSVLSSASAAGKYLKSINVGSGRYQPMWADLPAQPGDHQLLVSATDAAAGYLGAKLVPGSNITITPQTDGDGVQTLEISATGGGGGGGAGIDTYPIQLTSNYNSGVANKAWFVRCISKSSFTPSSFAVALSRAPIGGIPAGRHFAVRVFNSSQNVTYTSALMETTAYSQTTDFVIKTGALTAVNGDAPISAGDIIWIGVWMKEWMSFVYAESYTPTYFNTLQSCKAGTFADFLSVNTVSGSKEAKTPWCQIW